MSGTPHDRGGEPLLVAEQVQQVYRTPVRPAAQLVVFAYESGLVRPGWLN